MTAAPPRGGAVVEAVRRFDRIVDDGLEPWRDRPVVARAMTGITNAAEFSAIWHVASVARGLVVRRPEQVAALAVGLAAESLLVNQGLKRIFRRTRPTPGGDARFGLRTPLTTSFPSGHASSAAFAATILIGWDGRRWAPLWAGAAGLVALSRPYVRIHHASDVVAGSAVGVLLGLGALQTFRRLGVVDGV